ncbi:MAG: hypothetical protein L0Z50_15115, partial [Verrucomicrobiales bacterium]|nr:hypothetical protein [Verrucomicrobiales bacterium]
VEQQKRQAREERKVAAESARLEPFLDFWSEMDDVAKTDFEIQAVIAAKPLMRDGYRRLRANPGPTFEQYLQIILRDYFEQQRRVTAV